MKINYYQNNRSSLTGLIAGTTMKDAAEPENGNMALHICVSAENVLQNRKKLAASLGISLDNFVCPTQTHSLNFYEATAADGGRGAKDLSSAILDIDAVFTYEPNMLLCCFTADCVPLIFHNESDGLIGVIHSGWLGTVKEITLKVFHHLISKKGHRPADFKVYIGPAISQEKFEVDQDVFLQFKALRFKNSDPQAKDSTIPAEDTDSQKQSYALPYINYNEKTNKYHIDNKAVVKRQCELIGIPSENIFVDPTCTFQDLNCFSHRREKQTGRHLSFVMRPHNGGSL